MGGHGHLRQAMLDVVWNRKDKSTRWSGGGRAGWGRPREGAAVAAGARQLPTAPGPFAGVLRPAVLQTERPGVVLVRGGRGGGVGGRKAQGDPGWGGLSSCSGCLETGGVHTPTVPRVQTRGTPRPRPAQAAP